MAGRKRGAVVSLHQKQQRRVAAARSHRRQLPDVLLRPLADGVWEKRDAAALLESGATGATNFTMAAHMHVHVGAGSLLWSEKHANKHPAVHAAGHTHPASPAAAGLLQA